MHDLTVTHDNALCLVFHATRFMPHATDLAIAKVFAEIRRTKIDFAHRSDVAARSGSRELRAVKIPASYDAWRTPERQKKRFEKNYIFFNQKTIVIYGPSYQ